MHALDKAPIGIPVIIAGLYWLADNLVDRIGDIEYAFQGSYGRHDVVSLVIHYIFMVKLFQLFTALFPCDSLPLLVIGFYYYLEVVYIENVEVLQLVAILFEKVLDLELFA